MPDQQARACSFCAAAANYKFVMATDKASQHDATVVALRRGYGEEERTWPEALIDVVGRSALDWEQTHAAQQTTWSFDHLVGDGQ
jgi:hypothetical protein